MVIGDIYRSEFCTYDAEGELANADDTPTGTLVVNGIDSAASVTITNPTTGRYKVSVSLAGLSNGDICYVRIVATVDGVTAELPLPTFRIDAAISTRSTLSAAGVWAHTARSLTDKGGFTLDSTAVDAIRDGLATSEQVSQITAKLPSSAYLAGSDSEDGAVAAEVDAGEVAAAVLANPDNKIATNASGQVETSNPAVQRIVKVVQRQIKVITN